MAGHSKWANIQHRKGAQDKKKANVFAKLAKEITIAAKMGGSDQSSNSRLRLAVTTARGQSMPKANIERAIKKGSGELSGGENYEEIRYEGYGLSGIAFIVETLTDNKNRTASEIRTTFSKRGGALGETGSVSFSFERLGEIIYNKESFDEEKMFDEVTNSGADDLIVEDDYIIYCSMTDLNSVSQYLQDKFGEPKSATIVWKAGNVIAANLETAKKIIALKEALEDLEDVQSVYTNMEVDEDTLKQLL